MRTSPVRFTTLREMEHWAVEVAVESHLVKLVRTPAPFQTAGAVEGSFAEIEEVVTKFPTRSWGLVLDMRKTLPAANRQIEQALRTNRKRITALFSRHATLLATAAGVMQANRMLREHPDPKIKIFEDEHEAYRWASEPSSPD